MLVDDIRKQQRDLKENIIRGCYQVAQQGGHVLEMRLCGKLSQDLVEDLQEDGFEVEWYPDDDFSPPHYGIDWVLLRVRW